jgi:tRNA A-37 threonylcarbamoyl transferase component Bud32
MPQGLTRGVRVGDRYRLERELGRGAESVTWQASDERLDRPVALRFFRQDLDRRSASKRAAAAASLTHPRVVRVFDTGQDGDRFFTVSELMPSCLRNHKLPLGAEDAVYAALNVSEALAYAHDRGVVHGSLHEGNVLVSEAGAKVGDFGLAADGATKDADLREFGGLLRRISPMGQAALPVGYTRIVEGLTNGGYASADVVYEEIQALRPTLRPRAATTRRRAWVAGVTAAIAALVAVAVLQLGEQSPQGTQLLPGERVEGTPVAITGAVDYDPLGDEWENPEEVQYLIDGNPGTFWRTERYRGGPNFEGTAAGKDGVGVLFDLGEPASVGKAQLLFFEAGCSFELRHSDDQERPIGEWRTAARVSSSPQSAGLEFDGAEDRFWVLWLTQLVQGGAPGAGNRYACAVADIELFEP